MRIVFELYAIPGTLRVKLANLHFSGTSAFWFQTLCFTFAQLSWGVCSKSVSDRFERDRHHSLLRQFFHIKHLGSVAKYIEKFDDIVHQIIAHDSMFVLLPSLVDL